MVFLWLMLWWLKKKTSRGQVGMQDVRVRVVARQTLSPKASVSIVEIGDTTMVLGVTDHSVTHLGTVNSAREGSVPAPSHTPPTPTFGPPPTYPPTAPASMPLARTVQPPDSRGELPTDLSVQSYIKSLFKRGRSGL